VAIYEVLNQVTH